MRTRVNPRRAWLGIASTACAAFAAASFTGATPAAVAGSCTGTPVTVDGYGVCVTPSTPVTVFPGKVVWTPGVPKQYVNTPGVGPVPPQSVGTPIVPSEGVTVPPVVVQAPGVTPCTGGC